MIVRIAVPRPLWSSFDYELADGAPPPGVRVRVPFGRGSTIGVVIATPSQSNAPAPLKCVTEVLDSEPVLQADVLELIVWAAGYYRHPIGDAIFSALPVALRNGRPLEPLLQRFWQLASQDATTATARAPRQREALEWLRAGGGIASHDALLAAGFDGRLLGALERKGAIEPAMAGPAGSRPRSPAPPFELSSEQRVATDAVVNTLGRFECLLLEGVTGSGKTEVYLQAIDAVLERGDQALVLIPEIALTPQTLERFRARFGSAALYHSALSDRERARAWHDCRSGAASILIGTRSAIFVPFRRLGLIVVDEEHDGSYKQQEGFRYSARDLAAKRAQLLAIPLLLGTATPALETLHNAQRGRYRHLHLTARPGAARSTPIRLIDIRGLILDDGLSAPLKSAVAATLAQGNQVLLFINRRGYAPALLCSRCGWNPMCPRCESRLTLHQTAPQLRCHHCGYTRSPPVQCPDCGDAELRAIGVGTQRSASGIARLFPDTPVVRIDRDSTRSSAELNAHLTQIGRGEPAVLVGTQMLAKGHHFPRVTLVGVINADAGFASADFRAPEHTAQLIIQVAGRAGRAERPGEVWIQTYNPDNPLLGALVEHGYAGFAQAELAQRAAARLPPFRPMALLSADGRSIEPTIDCLTTLAKTFAGMPIEVLGPVAAPLRKRAQRFRCQSVLLADTRAQLGAGLDEMIRRHSATRFAGVRWAIDVDPYDMY